MTEAGSNERFAAVIRWEFTRASFLGLRGGRLTGLVVARDVRVDSHPSDVCFFKKENK